MWAWGLGFRVVGISGVRAEGFRALIGSLVQLKAPAPNQGILVSRPHREANKRVGPSCQ